MEFVLKNKLLRTSPSKILGIAYGAAAMDLQLRSLRMQLQNIGSEPDSKASPDMAEEKMLVDESSGQLIADYLQIPELAGEIKRAVWQVGRSLNAREEYREEKQEIDRVTTMNEK